MAFTHSSDGVRIAYDVFGRRSGEPLLMIQGLGADRRGWAFQRLAFPRHHRCIVMDNRGVGRSDVPPGPYDLLQMAEDAVAVLDAAGVESAHVMGASMGGVIAQVLAVSHPDRVRSLVLSCTACRHLPWRRELLESWAVTAQEQGMRALTAQALRWLLGPRWHRRFGLPLSAFAPLVLNVSAPAFVAQVRAILGADDALRAELATIAVPTLVIVGSQDILTPVGDSEELAERIPGAALAVITGAAHGLMIESAGAFNGTVLAFLSDFCAPERGLPHSSDQKSGWDGRSDGDRVQQVGGGGSQVVTSGAGG